jgi:hypothetical protein
MPGFPRYLSGAVLLCILCVPRPCSAVIEALTSLSKFEQDADLIAVMQVERLDLEKQTAVLTVAESIKGELAGGRMPLRLAGDSEGNTRDMVDRLAVGQRVVIFVTKGDTQNIAFAYTAGSWFQVLGFRDGDVVRWKFTHAEPYLRRTFRGTPDELATLLRDALAGRAKLPAPDEKETPGLGPVVERSGTAEPVSATNSAPEESAPVIPSDAAPPRTVAKDMRPWWAFAATVVIGLGGIVFLRLRPENET